MSFSGARDGSDGLSDARRRDDSRSLCVFASVVAVTMAAVGTVARAGSPIHVEASLEWTGLSLCLVNVATLGTTRGFWHRSAIWLYAATAFALVGQPATGPIAIAAGWIGTIAGLVLFAWNVARWVRSDQRRAISSVPLMASAVVLGLFSAGVHWGSGYANPLFEQALVAGQAHRDTLFHASLANMIGTYGVPSTGLDGLPFVRYHIGSHWIAAAFASLTGTDVLEFYNRAFGAIFLPVMFSTFLFLVLEVRSRTSSRAASLPVSDDWRFWGMVLLGFVGFLPFTLAASLDLDPDRIFLSESYMLGLALSFTLMAMALSFGDDWTKRRPTGVGDAIALLVAGPLLYAACGATKVSLMYLSLTMLGYAAWRAGLLRAPLVIAHFLLSGLVAGVIVAAMWKYQLPVGMIGEGWREIARIAWAEPWQVNPLYFFWPAACVLLSVAQLRIRTIADLRAAVRERQTLGAETALVCCLAGVVPGRVVPLGVDSPYFSHYQSLIGLGLVLASLPPISQRTVRTRSLTAPARIGIAGLFVALISVVLINTTTALSMTATESARVRGASQTSDAKARRSLLGVLRNVAALPRSEKRATVLFIPKFCTTYWNWEPSHATSAFIAPAVSGVAMIGGLPDDMERDDWDSYGFAFYYPASGESMGHMDVSQLLTRATALGFRQVLTIEPDATGTCRLNTVIGKPSAGASTSGGS